MAQTYMSRDFICKHSIHSNECQLSVGVQLVQILKWESFNRMTFSFRLTNRCIYWSLLCMSVLLL